MLASIDRWIARERVDMVLVVGTSSLVWPAAGFAEQARGGNEMGTSVVHVNLDAEEEGNLRKLGRGDFAFAGDAGEVLGRLLAPVVGAWDAEAKGFVR
jgi:NAD-dependent SIR2 family protein deacetylase